MAMFSYDHILVRYGELAIKGKNRNEFVKKLLANIKRSLADFPDLAYERTYDRIYIKLAGQDVKQISSILKEVFGISSFSIAVKTASDLDKIVAEATEIMQHQPVGTFKVITRRKDKTFPINSDGINRAVASQVLKTTEFKVDVKNPDLKLLIEVNSNETYIMPGQILGAGGFPTGTGGKALLLLSGGIDSPVAGYLTMKKGVVLEAIHFASPPYTSQQALNKVKVLAEKLSFYQGSIKLHIIPFTKLQLEIHQNCPHAYEITLLRRMMLRIAEAVAIDEKALAIVSGESIGQVASQTLESFLTINAVSNYPILRPLVSLDKVEIVNIAKKIDSYETSILPYEDCCTIFTPRNPVIKPSINQALLYESRLDYESLINECLANKETIIIKPNSLLSSEIF